MTTERTDPDRAWTPVRHSVFRDAALAERIHERGYAVVPMWRDSELAGPAGQVIAFYHRVIHGSPPNGSGRPRIAVACTLVPKTVPLQISFQRDAAAPLQVYQPADDFIYEFNNVRDDTASVPPGDRPNFHRIRPRCSTQAL